MKIIQGHKYLYKKWRLSFGYDVKQMEIIDITKTCYHVMIDGKSKYWLKEDFDSQENIEIIEDLGI